MFFLFFFLSVFGSREVSPTRVSSESFFPLFPLKFKTPQKVTKNEGVKKNCNYGYITNFFFLSLKLLEKWFKMKASKKLQLWIYY